MRTCRIFFSLLAFLFLSPIPSTAQGNKVDVKRAWAPGTYVMTQTAKSQGEQIVGNESAKNVSTETNVWELRVGEPNSQGEKKITAKVVKCQFTEEGDAAVSYNSEAPAAQQDKDMAFVYGSLIGAPVEIMLDADDAVIEVSGLDKLWTNLSAKASNDVQKGRLAQVSIEISDKVIEQSLRRLESVAPKKAVATGEKWTAGVRSELPLIGEIKQRYDCLLKGVENSPEGKLAVIQLEARYEATKPKPGIIQGQEITVSKLDVTEKGDVKFDLETGIAAVDEKNVNVSAILDAKDDKGRPLRVTVKGANQIKTTIVPSSGQAVQAPAAPDASAAPGSPGQGGQGVQKMLRGLPPKSPPPDSSRLQQQPAPQASTAPVSYVVFRCIDQGGIRDQATGEWLEAFRLFMPRDWKFQGGLRWVANEKRPDQFSKTDALMPVKSDYSVFSPDGRKALRSYPAQYWVDTSRTPANKYGYGFKPGNNYNGMIVSPVLSPEQYISSYVYPHQRGQVANIKVVKQEPLPKLAELYAAETARFNQIMASTNTQGNLAFKAGTITMDYTDGQTPYRETFVAVIQYIDTAGMVMFWPRVNFSFRAPRDEFDQMLPVFTTIATSVQSNPRWTLHLVKLTQRSAISQREMDDYCHRIQREIAESHAATTSELARDMGYLTSPHYAYKGTDGNRYVLPTDKYHFMNAQGELLSQNSWDPPSSEWKSIEPYNQ
ncbi:MAG: DUF6263 family protein [Desulfobacteraceae bacterium]|nr:DUF6263 family protein [Desulfobacteraceae bacterium]